jgi:hypothetical protein
MIKIVGRFMIILLAACLVAGGLYWLVEANPSRIGLPDGQRELRGQGLRDLSEEDEGLEMRPQRDFKGGGGEHNLQPGSLDAQATSGILRSLLIIALTTLTVLGIQKAITWVKRQRQARSATPPAD